MLYEVITIEDIEDELFNAMAGQLEAGLVRPAYDYALKCSHTFNLLDARGAISITERTGYIHRVRNLAGRVARLYAAQRKDMEYPMLQNAGGK